MSSTNRGRTREGLTIATRSASAYPIPRDDVFLGLIGERAPGILSVLTYGYATLWFTTPYFAASLMMSVMAIIVYRRAPHMRVRPLPPYPQPEQRSTLSLVLGERHHQTTPGPAARPEWLVVPQRGLYTGIMVLGAVGTGKTSACMYPYVDQLLRWRADDPERKLGGMVLEVKGDFCGQVKSMLRRTGRENDYVEVGLDSGFCYNPLHQSPAAFLAVNSSLVARKTFVRKHCSSVRQLSSPGRAERNELMLWVATIGISLA